VDETSVTTGAFATGSIVTVDADTLEHPEVLSNTVMV
jgi:hypothetical protein